MSKTMNLRYVIFLACTAALGGLLFGFDVAIITGAGPFLTRHFALSDISLGWAFSSLLFGCVLGSFAAGRLTDRLGRKRMLVWVAVLFALTSVATAARAQLYALHLRAISRRHRRRRGFAALAHVRVGGFAALHSRAHGHASTRCRSLPAF